ncbi:MAG TPA: hypothetical protein V6D28_06625 [Leptolyngbyaceae cyanobacterium]
MARPKKEDHPERLERWAGLLNHLKQQIQVNLDEQQKNELLLRFLSRNASKSIASLTSLERWLAGEQLPSPTTRALVASALGLSRQVLDGFLFKGTPSWMELSQMLPPISQEYKNPSYLDLGAIDARNEANLLPIIKLLLSYLSLSKLVEIRDFISSQIEQEITRLKLNISTYQNHPLRLIIQENCIRSGGSERFAEIILSGEPKDLTRSSLFDIITGIRLPNQKELKALSLYLKDRDNNYYPHDFLAALLADKKVDNNQLNWNDRNCQENFSLEKTENGANYEGGN